MEEEKRGVGLTRGKTKLMQLITESTIPGTWRLLKTI
jgi:hypothetical protein